MCVAVPTDRNNISLTTYASVTNRVGSHYRHRRVARKLILILIATRKDTLLNNINFSQGQKHSEQNTPFSKRKTIQNP